MRRILLILLLAMSISAFAGIFGVQGYRPKPGETVLRVQVEGRGEIYIKLHTKEAPKTTGQIARLAKSGFYDGQRFHRVERDPKPYLVQLGDPASKDGSVDLTTLGAGGSGTKIPFEATEFAHVEGAVGLARLPDNRDSGDSQFYIVMSPAKFLDGRYTVFGQVVQGMEVVRRIERGDRISSITILQG